MSRRRLLILMSAVALLGMAGFALNLWLTTPTPGVSMENFRRLQIGMPASAVYALLGDPYKVSEGDFEGATERLWGGQEVEIILVFKRDRLFGGVASPPGQHAVGHVERVPMDETFLDRIRRLLHW